MIVELGAFALVLALALSVGQVGLSVAGRVRHDATLRGAGEGAALAAALAMVLAFGALMTAFVTSDFSVVNVAANSTVDQPLFYRVTATWGSHEGSMLLWNLALTVTGAAIALFGANLPVGLKASALACQGALGAAFIGYTAFASNPFVRSGFTPIDGQSLNPILQDPFMAIHPPFLYSGYVGFSVVFSLAVAALVEGRVDAAWGRWVRPWALGAWSLLTIGITLGSFWAYYELGWGGWWFWDPVENSSFMPWLVGAGLIHSAIVTEKRGALTGWTVFLALSAFSFSMLGAFLVRSGVLTSVHAFAVDPKRGMLLLIILALASGTGFTLYAWRAPKLAPGGLFATVSREGALVLNNLFFAAAAVTVALGTLYPLARQALTGQSISVGAPYYALTFAPLMGLCLLVLPVGPLLAWKRGDLRWALSKLWIAAIVGVLAGLLVLALVTPRQPFAALGVAAGAWLIAGALSEVATRARLGAAGVGETLRRLRRLSLGEWGMTLAHIGVGVFVLGASCELAWRVQAAQVLQVGQSVRSAGYTLTLQDVASAPGPNFDAERATLRVTPPHGAAFTMTPERRFYPARRQTTSKVAISRRGASDLYVVLGEQSPGRSAWLVRAFYNPLARFIFFGPVLMALGGACSLADRRLRLVAGRRATVAQAAVA
jgi:cytochrome c-type biogenesis protein CcmF